MSRSKYLPGLTGGPALLIKKSPRKLLICIPLHHGESPAFRRFFGALQSAQAAGEFQVRGWDLEWQEVGNFGIDDALDLGANRALAHNFDAIFYLATDQSAEVGDVLSMLDKLVRHPDKKIGLLSGLYCHKHRPLSIVLNYFRAQQTDSATGLWEVDETGFDFAMIPVDCLRKIRDKFPERYYDATPIEQEQGVKGQSFQFFTGMIVDSVIAGKTVRRKLTQDFAFAYLVRAVGLSVYIDSSVLTKHWVGNQCFDAHEWVKEREAEAEKANTGLWPKEFLSPQLSSDHAVDVLSGSYDVPYDPVTPPVVLDIGANVGAFARWAVKRWPGCELHCFEPFPENFKLLERTREIYGLKNVFCHNVAVLNYDGMANMANTGHNCGEARVVGPETKNVTSVDCISAAELPRADVLKLDTEGSEVRILRSLAGAGRLRKFSAVMVEYHSAVDRGIILEIMAEFGFEVTADHTVTAERGEIKFVRADIDIVHTTPSRAAASH